MKKKAASGLMVALFVFAMLPPCARALIDPQPTLFNPRIAVHNGLLYLSYVSGVGTPELSMMTFNGSFWDQIGVPENKNAPFSPDMAVNPEPVLFDPDLTMVTTVNPEPVLFDPRVNPEPVLFEPNIMIRTYNDTKGEWTGPTLTPNCTAMGANPTVTYYNNETFLIWENTNSTPSTIRVMNFTMFNWGNECEIGVGSHPTATVYNDELHVVFRDGNDTLVHKIYNGSDWSEDNPRGLIDPQPTPCGPRITVHNGLLYLTYLNGSEPSSLPYLQAFNGTTWTSSHHLENYGDLSPCNPAITSFNNTLYLFYASIKDGHIYYQTFEGELGDGTWSTPTQVPAPVHYIRVENIIPSKTVVVQNHTVSINVTVDNIGLFNETFNIIVYHTDPATEKTPWGIPNSTQYDDFFHMGDVNGDGYIDLIDYSLIADQVFTSNPRYDIDESGLVDIDDLLICGINYGKDIWTHFLLTLPPIEKQTVEDLPPGNSTITFTWNTTGVPFGNYTISVVTGAWVAHDWSGVGDDPTIIAVTIPGDINGDCIVDIVDIVIVALAFGSQPGDDNWNPLVDIAAAYGLIDIVDIVAVAIHFGDTCP